MNAGLLLTLLHRYSKPGMSGNVLNTYDLLFLSENKEVSAFDKVQ